MNTPDRYLDVTGEGEFEETAARFIAQVNLEVRAAKDETALREVSELCTEALVVLREAGIREDEIVEGGAEFNRPWYWKKQVGQNAGRRIILKVDDFGRLQRALEQLEPLQSRNKERRTLSVDMQQPEFKNSAEAKAAALAQAFADALAKGTQLAAAMQGSLGPALRVEEGTWTSRGSGFASDHDWGDGYRGGYVLMAAAGGAAAPPPDPQRPTRTISIQCRVRFAVS